MSYDRCLFFFLFNKLKYLVYGGEIKIYFKLIILKLLEFFLYILYLLNEIMLMFLLLFYEYDNIFLCLIGIY